MWQFIYLMELSRYLEECEVHAKVYFECFVIYMVVWLYAIVACACLAAYFIRYSDDGTFVYARKFVYEFFNLARVDIFTNRYDHVLDAIDDLEIPVFFPAHDVARV